MSANNSISLEEWARRVGYCKVLRNRNGCFVGGILHEVQNTEFIVVMMVVD